MKVSIVVVSYNARSYLERCLSALEGLPFEQIVVDNASTDGSADYVADRFPGVALLRMESNLGFGAAGNRGVRWAQGKYILLMNPDAWPTQGAVVKLLAYAERRPRVGAVGPRLLDSNGEPTRSIYSYPTQPFRLAVWVAFPDLVGATYGSFRHLRELLYRLVPSPRGVKSGVDHVRDHEFLPGAVLLLRREAIEEIGGFDENFFLFAEDADLCRRLRDAGWTVEHARDAEFTHVGGGSTKADATNAYAIQLRAHFQYIAKHFDVATAERARKWAVRALRLQARVLRGDRQRRYSLVANSIASQRFGAHAAPSEALTPSGPPS